MVALFLTTIINCNQAHQVIKRIQENRGLPASARQELIQEILQVIPSCPIIIKQDESKSK